MTIQRIACELTAGVVTSSLRIGKNGGVVGGFVLVDITDANAKK